MTAKPNILFIISDQQHWEAVGYMDSTFQTPNLDGLAEEGTIFTSAFCTTPQCSPSRSSILTGFYPSKTGVLGNIGSEGGNSLQMKTIGANLQDAGYYTAYFGKWHLGKHPDGTAGWNEDFGVTGPETTDDNEVTRRGLNFIESRAGLEQPFALFLSYNNPHDIYEFNNETIDSFDTTTALPSTWSDQDFSHTPQIQLEYMEQDQGSVIFGKNDSSWKRYRELYREKTAMYDHELGKIIKALHRTDSADNTLKIITSDHGDMDTQHRLIYKGPFMYEHMMRVPLIIQLPESLRSDSTPSKIVSPTVNVDLSPTIADIAGIPFPLSDGISLKPALLGESKVHHREYIIGQYYSKQKWVNPIRMIRSNSFKYNLYRTDRNTWEEELYNIEHNLSEIDNHAEDVNHIQTKTELKEQLNCWIDQNEDPFYSQKATTLVKEIGLR
jgi:arylsulfatase A-like enzyme